MSSPQAIDSAKVHAAQEAALSQASKEKQDFALSDATQKHEETIHAKDDEIDMTDAVAQAGRRLERYVLEKRLKELNGNLRFERSKAVPDKSGIYLGESFLCGMEWESSPEFTVNFVGFDESTKKEEVLHQVRGWRSVLATLIKKGAIERTATEKLFQIYQGRESANWYHSMR